MLVHATIITKYVSLLTEIQTLRIGDFAAQIGNDPGGVCPGTMAEGDQRKILHLVAQSNLCQLFLRSFKIKAEQLRVFFCVYLFKMCDALPYCAS